MSGSGKPLDKAIWQGRVDNEEDGDTRRWHQHIAAWFSGAAPGVALIGFACDAGVRRNHGRPGASQGPAGIRRALANLAWHGRLPAYDAGDVVVASSDADPGDLEAGQNTLAQEVSTLLDEGQRVLVLGGGHEVAFASHMGIRRHLANQQSDARVGVVNLDAHFDLRGGSQGSSGTPFRQIAELCAEQGAAFRYLCLGVNEDANTAALFSNALKWGAGWRNDREMCIWQLAEARAQLAEFVASVDRIHLSIDLDVLPAAVAPGVSAPAARGVSLEVVECLIGDLLVSGKLMLADIAEYNPNFDIDQRTARVAARLAAYLTR